jgi:hypothetical protein
MPLSPDERRGLDRARAHYRAAVAELPAGRYGHMRSILKSFITSIDDEIGPEDGTGGWHDGHAGDCRCEAEGYPGRSEFLTMIRAANTPPAAGPDDLDSEMPYGAATAPHPKDQPMPDERELAHQPSPNPWPVSDTAEGAEFGPSRHYQGEC